MDIRRIVGLIPAVVLVVASGAANVVADETAGDLKLHLAVEKTTYAPYEPVVLQYELRNLSDASSSYVGDVGPHSDWIKFEVGQGAFHPYRTGPVVCRFNQNPTVAPHESLRAQLLMISNQYSRSGNFDEARRTPPFPFSAVGQYQIRARYPKGSGADGGEIRSNVISVTVREATEREKQALAFFESPSDFSIAMGGEAASVDDSRRFMQRDRPDVVERWEEFVRTFGDTPYAPFVRFNLASQYRGAPDSESLRPDPAIEHLKAIVKMGPRSIVDDALLELAETEIQVGRIDEATGAIAQLLRAFPDSERAGDAKRIRDGLKAGRRTLKEIYGN